MTQIALVGSGNRQGNQEPRAGVFEKLNKAERQTLPRASRKLTTLLTPWP